MRKVFTPPPITGNLLFPLLAALVMTAFLFFVLPLTQMLSASGRTRLTLTRIDVSLPPPPPPPPKPPPPPEEKKEEQKPELREQPRPLTLSQIEMALNPGIGSALQGDFSLDFARMDALPDTVAEMRIFELAEVDRNPEPIRTVPPQYPPRLQAERVAGTVIVEFIVDDSGVVRQPKLRRGAPQPEFNRAAIAALEQYRFSPALKDGQPVRVRMYQEFEFKPPR
jgi:periplasmic protein TonB